MVLERAVPAQVDQIRLTGFAANGEIRYGPEVRTKSRVIDFEAVPTDCTQVQLELISQTSVVGVGRVQVRLASGQVFRIFDPDFEDVAAVLTSLALEPASLRLAVGTSGGFRLVGYYGDGSILELSRSASWETSSDAIEVDAQGKV